MKLSIITINFNNASELLKTIHSVLKQSWMDFEFLIIDGGSTDQSLEHIKAIDDKLAYWVSEKDNGVFHAMNKGILKAKGEYLLMMNAGDYFHDNDVLRRIFGTNEFNEDILYGDVERAAESEVFASSIFPDTLTFNFFRKGSLSHQSSFIKRDLHSMVGMYDQNFKYCSDWKFFILAICKYNVSYRHLPFLVAVCDCGGLTCNPANFPAMALENHLVLKQFFPAFLNDYRQIDILENQKLKNRVSSLKRNVKAFIKMSLAKSFLAF
jgi:glycosyltransferase involved in cell wall biosynthesis